jgi:hypothetical protein
MRPRPLPPHQVAVPPKEGLRPHQEGPPLLSREQSARCRQERPIARPVDRALHLAPQDRELVAEGHDLRVPLRVRTTSESHQPEQLHQDDIEEGQEHEAGFSQTKRGCDQRAAESDFRTPRV